MNSKQVGKQLSLKVSLSPSQVSLSEAKLSQLSIANGSFISPRCFIALETFLCSLNQREFHGQTGFHAERNRPRERGRFVDRLELFARKVQVTTRSGEHEWAAVGPASRTGGLRT